MIENITYYPLKLLWWLFSIIPLPVLYILSDISFFFLYYAARYRGKVVRRNLGESFPEKSTKEIIGIEKKFYRFFVDLLFETCKFATISEKAIKRRMKFVNIEEVNKVLAEGKSISTYMGHYGNWEWVSSLPLHLDENVVAAQVYRALRNKATDRLLLDNRGRLGAVSVEMKKLPRWINTQIENHVTTITGYIADQSPRKREQRHYVQFLNHEVPTLVGTEKLTKRYGTEAWFMEISRVKRGYYEATFVKLHEDPQSLPDFELTDLYYRQLEKMVRRQPELYLWSHKRFKYARE